MNERTLVFPVNGLLKSHVETAGFFAMDLEGLSQDERGNPTPLPPQIRTQIEAAQRGGIEMVILAHHQNDPSICRISELFKEARIPVPRVQIVDLKRNPDPVFEVKRALIGESGQNLGSSDQTVSKPTWKPFPLVCLPDSLREFVYQVAKVMNCDPALVVIPCLVVAASAIGLSRSARINGTWRSLAILWGAVISESGGKKSPVLSLVLDPLKKQHLKRYKEYQEILKEYRRIHREWKADLVRFEKGKPGCSEPQDEPEKPVFPVLIANDTTIEKLVKNLAHSPRGILSYRDELSGWFGSFTKYSQSSDLPTWLSFHTGETIIRDRVGVGGETEHTVIHRPAVSVLGGIPPGVLARHLTQENADAGLDARLLIAFPPKSLDRWTSMDLPVDTQRKWARLIDDLLSLEMDKDEEGNPVPLEIEFTPEAMKRWELFYNEWALVKFLASGSEASLASKLEGTVPRLALIFHLCDQTFTNRQTLEPIEEIQMDRAIEIIQWFREEWARVREVLGTKTETLEDRLLGLLKNAGGNGLTKTAIHGALGNNKDRTEINGALSALKTKGLADFRRDATTGGRHSEIWFSLESGGQTNLRINEESPP